MRSLTILLAAAMCAVGLLIAGPAGAQPFFITWQLEELSNIQDEDDDDFTPSSPYTIELDSDGEVDIEADCNLANGNWEGDVSSGSSGEINITIGLTAVSGCSSPTFEEPFLDLLEDAESFFWDEDDETLTLRGANSDGSGWEMEFSPASG
jgi:heat shock protein HslJ